MENNKLTGILQTFSRKENTDFCKYLDADFFCINIKVRKLYRILLNYYPRYNDSHLNKENIYVLLFGKEKYNDKKIRYLLTDLTRHAENFLSYKCYENDFQQKKVLLARELSKRDCEKAYFHHYNEILNPQTKVRDASFYFNRYLAELDHLIYEIPRQKRKAQLTVASVVSDLDKFYIARKLQLCCEIFNVKNVMQFEHNVFLLDELLAYLNKNKMEEVPVIGIYYQILMTLFYSDDEQHFLKLQVSLVQQEEKITSDELRDIYQYVLNYCIKKINLGNLEYQNKLFDTYKTILNNKVIFVDNYLSQWDFKNICTISFRLKEFVWAGQFIDQYHQFIKTADRENAFTYNKAYLHFHKGEFNISLGLLQQVNFTDLYYQIDTRAMLLKIYFELNDHEALRYHLQAFKIFLNRNKLISVYQRTIYSNLVKFTTKLIANQTRKAKLQILQKEIKETPSTADQQWLLKKTMELSKINSDN